MRTPKHLINPDYTRHSLGRPAGPVPRANSQRVVFVEHDSISVWAWPSRGGLIVLEHAGPLDFDYLGLDRAAPAAASRCGSQADEDRFCQRLLRLGARWFDSRERYGFVANVAADSAPEIEAIECGEQPPPSRMERRWVSVGVVDDDNGDNGAPAGFWVLDCDRVMYSAEETRNLVPEDAARLALAESMQERCDMLKTMGATFYRDLADYQGPACLNAWETKTTGEFGPLVVHA